MTRRRITVLIVKVVRKMRKNEEDKYSMYLIGPVSASYVTMLRGVSDSADFIESFLSSTILPFS